MPGQPVEIGPWSGLNQQFSGRDDRIDDSELAECLNFEFLDDGSLRPRGAVVQDDPGTGSAEATFLGVVNFNSTSYIFGARKSGTGSLLYVRLSSLSNWIPIFNGAVIPGIFTSVIYYANNLYFLSINTETTSFRSDAALVVNNPASSPARVNLTGLKPGTTTALVIKDRLFSIDGARVSYSKATDFNNFVNPDGGFFDVLSSDGNIQAAVVAFDQLIIFKQASTYVFTFTTNPATDGNLRTVSNTQGAYSAVVYRNQIYCCDGINVYTFSNNYFVPVGDLLDLKNKVNLNISSDSQPNYGMAAGGDRLVIGSTYPAVLNLKTGAWSVNTFAEFDGFSGVFIRPVYVTVFSGNYVTYYEGLPSGSSTFNEDTNILGSNIYKGYDNGVKGNDVLLGTSHVVKYRFRTKSFDFTNSSEWKRLYGWFLDGSIKANSLPEAIYVIINNLRPSKGVPTEVSESTNRESGLITTLSSRFKYLQFAVEYDSTSPANLDLIAGIVAWISSKTKTSDR